MPALLVSAEAFHAVDRPEQAADALGGAKPRLPPGADPALPLALGGAGVSLREKVALYAGPAADGTGGGAPPGFHRLTILDADGEAVRVQVEVREGGHARPWR